MEYKIIIVEDDKLIRSMVEVNLRNEGYITKSFTNSENMLKTLTTESCDAMILDMNLPGMQGPEALAAIRKKGHNFPVMMLTVNRDMDSKRASFKRGADDFLTKPFCIEELILRVSALIRRAQGQRVLPSENVIVINGHKINTNTRECNSNSGNITLSALEIKLLKHMVVNSGVPQTRADLLEEVWGMESDSTPRTIDNFILKFRKLFEPKPSSPQFFISVRGKGYMYVEAL